MSRTTVFNEFNSAPNVLYLKRTLYSFITDKTNINYNNYMECFESSLWKFSTGEKSRTESAFIDVLQAVKFLNLKFMNMHIDALLNRAPKNGTPVYTLSDGMIMSYNKTKGQSADDKLKQWRDKPRAMAIYRDDTHGAVGQKSDVGVCNGARSHGIEMYSVSNDAHGSDSWRGSGMDDVDAVDSRDDGDDDYTTSVLKEECNYGVMNTPMANRKLGHGVGDTDVFRTNELGQINGFKQARVRMHRRMVERNIDEEVNSVEYDVGGKVRGFDMRGIKNKIQYRTNKRKALMNDGSSVEN